MTDIRAPRRATSGRRTSLAAVPAGYALAAGCTGLLIVGAFASALHASSGPVLAAVAVVVGLTAIAGGPDSAALIAVVGWLAATGFSRAPYAELQPRGTTAVWVLALVATAGQGLASGGRMIGRGRTLADVALIGTSLGRRRELLALAVATVALPLATALLVAARADLRLADDLLVYLVLVLSVTLVGGFWPSVLAAVAADLLVNWFFTEPLHTLTVAEPQNLLALLLFVLVAVLVSAVVHLAARRTAQARANGQETDTLLDLARTVFAGADTPAQVLAHLHSTLGFPADLTERNGARWTTVAAVGDLDLSDVTTVNVRDDLLLRVSGCGPRPDRLLAAFAAQAAGALDRDRLRAQAAQAEAYAAGNRMRTALLAAVSHDLRTPLASVKAAVSSLRQDDIVWSAVDEADLLATIETEADRLDALIGNLLDMSRLQTGALHPLLRDTSLDEVVPLALRSLDGARDVRLDLPDSLPLVRTDPGLLERVVANLVANAVRFSPPGRPPSVSVVAQGDSVSLTVADHGPGIAEDQYQRIFEPFQRLGDAGTGVGLGLAVARGFCEAMGIAITPGTTPGGGLSMVLQIRAVAAPELASVR